MEDIDILRQLKANKGTSLDSMRRMFQNKQCGIAFRFFEVLCHPIATNMRRTLNFEKWKTRQFVKYALLTIMLIQLPIFMIVNMRRGGPLQRSTSAVTSTEIANDIFQRRQREVKKEGLGERKILVNSRNDLTADDTDNYIFNYAKESEEDNNHISLHGKFIFLNY